MTVIQNEIAKDNDLISPAIFHQREMVFQGSKAGIKFWIEKA